MPVLAHLRVLIPVTCKTADVSTEIPLAEMPGGGVSQALWLGHIISFGVGTIINPVLPLRQRGSSTVNVPTSQFSRGPGCGHRFH